MAVTTIAGQWLLENDGLKRKRMAHWSEPKQPNTRIQVHLRKCAKRPLSPREFVEANRQAKADDCIFVPFAMKDRPARVVFCGKGIAAAKYMLLLTQGTAGFEGAVARHLCGNGHLSCINPGHLAWGTEADNRSDAVRHRGLTSTAEKIAAVRG